ncbi:MAG: selenocysteine-specific translation elongation factor [candidate division WOR-3 bacterium]
MAELSKRHIVIGTAGHIDHGKSALIKSLTGVDPDRLKEEKERGMTTDLGFVFYGDDATIIDVPGHEKFIRHMVAGASTIDLVILVIAADDGIMPQTYEHLEILKLLGIKKGIVVITKKDLVSAERLAVVSADVKSLLNGTFLANAPIIAVSNATGEGIDTLKQVLNELIAKVEVKIDRGVFRMPIDRCFIIKGFGTIVAGTVLSGKVKIGDVLELLPHRKPVKVRGIEVHNKQVNEVGTGFRAALNITGVEKEEIARGDVLAEKGFFEPSYYINASLHLLASAKTPLKNFTRLRIHIGTKEHLGRVVLLDKKILSPGEDAIVQFRLETPAVCSINDNYVIRTYSPQMTIGGGSIIESKAEKVKGFDEKLIEHLKVLEFADTTTIVEQEILTNFELPRKVNEIAADVNLPIAEVREIIKKLISEQKILVVDTKREVYYHQQNYQQLKDKIIKTLSEYHKLNPSSIGMLSLELLKKISPGLDKQLLDYALAELVKTNVIQILPDKKIKLTEFQVVLDSELTETVQKIERLFLAQAFQPLTFDELKDKIANNETLVRKAFQYLLDIGKLVNIGEGLVIHQAYLKKAQKLLCDFLKENKTIRVAQFRDLLNASRRSVLPLLIYFDTLGITVRRGDFRELSSKYQKNGGGV